MLNEAMLLFRNGKFKNGKPYLGKCLKYINDTYDQNCILEVYTFSQPTGRTKSDLTIDTIKLCEPLVGKDLKDKLTSSDFLVHAESFESEGTQIMMLSVSTKIPEYLLSNCCIVAVGPSELASIDLLEINKLGIVLSNKKSIEQHADKIFNVMKDLELYNDYCKKSINYCEKVFDAVKMRKQLKNKLLKI